MISIITSHHDEAFAEATVHVLHPREELVEYAELSRKHGVKLELETWHTGSIWNISWLIERGLLDPHFVSIFFDWPGGSWMRRPSRSTSIVGVQPCRPRAHVAR